MASRKRSSDALPSVLAAANGDLDGRALDIYHSFLGASTDTNSVNALTTELFHGGLLPSVPGTPTFWLNKNQEPIVIKFPGFIDRQRFHSNIDPCFGLFPGKVTVQALKDLKAVFEVLPVPNDPTRYPPEAILCSSRAFLLLQELKDDANEITLPQEHGSANAKPTKVVNWVHIDRGSDNPGAPVALLENRAVQQVLSPVLKDMQIAPNSTTEQATTAVALLGHREDLQDFFAGHPTFANAKVAYPNVLDAYGTVVAPTEYLDKVKHHTPVEVEVSPCFFDEIHPVTRQLTRTYELKLRSMQLFTPTYFHPSIPHLISPPETPSPKKKRKVDRVPTTVQLNTPFHRKRTRIMTTDNLYANLEDYGININDEVEWAGQAEEDGARPL